MTQTNRAVVLVKANTPLEIRPTDYPTPNAGELVVRTRALAMNPVDWAITMLGTMFLRWASYPLYLGTDVAGEVVAVGSDVTRFRPGDRILGLAVGTDPDVNERRQCAFQEFVVLKVDTTSAIPDHMSFTDASVFPLAIATAATALFNPDMLELSLPVKDPSARQETVLVWGASSSVGSATVQLARAAGYDVLATCSPHNFDLVKRLGARAVFDYHDANVARDITAAYQGRASVGAVAFGSTSCVGCMAVLSKVPGRKLVIRCSAPVDMDKFASAKSPLAVASRMLAMMKGTLQTTLRSTVTGVKSKFPWGSDLKKTHVGKAVFEYFLPEALSSGTMVPAPPAEIVGEGLERVQDALDVLKKGVSAKKIVVAV